LSWQNGCGRGRAKLEDSDLIALNSAREMVENWAAADLSVQQITQSECSFHAGF